LVDEAAPIPEALYPKCVAQEGISGEPIERVLSCLRDLNEDERREFFNLNSKQFDGLTPAELLCGRPEGNAVLKASHSALLQLPFPVRLDMVAGAATRFHEMVFQQLRDMDGAAGDTEKRKMLLIRRASDHLLVASTRVFGESPGPLGAMTLGHLRRYKDELEEFISKAQHEADPTVYFNSGN